MAKGKQNNPFDFGDDLARQISDITKKVEDLIKDVDKKIQDLPSVPQIEGPTNFTDQSNFESTDENFLSRLIDTSVSRHSWTRSSSVTGHYRTSKNGNVHYVRGHSRDTGDFWNWAAWTPLSWVALPVVFLMLQLHHAWNIKGILWHLFIASVASLFADAALILGITLFIIWIIYKLIRLVW
jgi:hypothetical protein